MVTCCVEMNGSRKQTQNRHKFLLIPSAELLLAYWPSSVAIQVCAVAMNVSVTDNTYILSEYIYCVHPFWRG